MKTAVIQIGNSDDKLPQKTWSNFVLDVQSVIQVNMLTTHFSGTSASSAPWQNACWVVEIPNPVDYILRELREELGVLAEKYEQNSIALTIGDTEFVSGRYKP